MTENEHVKLGAYHTLELELQRAFTIHKACLPPQPLFSPPSGRSLRTCRGARMF
jgi:hypothetical protein